MHLVVKLLLLFLARYLNFAIRACEFKGKWHVKFMLARSSLKPFAICRQLNLPCKWLLLPN